MSPAMTLTVTSGKLLLIFVNKNNGKKNGASNIQLFFLSLYPKKFQGKGFQLNNKIFIKKI